jgi:mycothiol synthase
MKETRLPNGFQMRPMRLEDVAGVVEVINASIRKVWGVDKQTVEEGISEWSDPAWDLEQDTRVVTDSKGRIVGYAEVWDQVSPFVHIYTYGKVHPDFTGLGIGSYLTEWAERRSYEYIGLTPEGTRVTILDHVPALAEDACRLMENNGFTRARSHHNMRIDMITQPPAPVVPDGVVIRHVQPDEVREVMRTLHECFVDHWNFLPEPFEQEWERVERYMKTDPTLDLSLWFVAEANGEFCGACRNRMKPEEGPGFGWIGSLGVRRIWRKKGIGLALLQASFGEFYRRGVQHVGLGVDASSLTGALKLYERAGMQVYRSMNFYEKEIRPGIELGTRSVEA